MNHSDRSELLVEAIPESLKNLLLVMETDGIFHTPDGYTKLWAVTWEKIDLFLPSLRTDLIRSVPPVDVSHSLVSTPSQNQHQGFHYENEGNVSGKLSLINTSAPKDLPFVFTPNIDIQYVPEYVTAPSGSEGEENTIIPPNEDQEKEVIERESLVTTSRKNSDAESYDNHVLVLSTPPSSPEPEPSSGRAEYTSIIFGDEDTNTSALFS